MIKKITAAVFVYSLILTLLVPVSAVTKTGNGDEMATRLANLEAKFEKRRKELGIPGMSVAIIKDGKVILSKGYGYKDFEKKIPMTPDTQLAIGSATKAFTGLSTVMLQDDGKISLDDNPSKHLPYFKINNAETQEKIQVRDLMTHSSGLNRTDLAMITGKLNRVELIKVAGEAKPMAGLRERFYYQNLMYAAAGELVAEVSGSSWEKFVKKRIFKPLGMKNSNLSIKAMQKAKDHSYGYEYNFDTKQTRRLPMRDIGAVGPAGSINSSANDMAKWVMFGLNGGVVNGKRLISEEGFKEWTKGHMNVAPNGSVKYALGWFVQSWGDKKVLQHGGNIDGFNSIVGMMPEEKVGVVVLTNVSGSSLPMEIMNMTWSALLANDEVEKAGDEQKKEVGKYNFKEAGFDVDVQIEDGYLVAKVPGQPTYRLKKVEGRKYALTGAPAGFFITFKDTEAFLEQPQGNFTLKKRGTEKESTSDETDKTLESLIGSYAGSQGPQLEIRKKDGKVSLIVPGQPAYPLKKVADGRYGSPSLPETYYLEVQKSDKGAVTGIVMNQPQGSFTFNKKEESKKDALISADDLIEKIIAAGGGRENMLKVRTQRAEIELDAVHQGVKGSGVIYSKFPNKQYAENTFTALGKKIGTSVDVFDGKNGYQDTSFTERTDFTGKRLVDVTFAMQMNPFARLKDLGVETRVSRKTKLGDKEVYILEVEPKGGSTVLFFVDTKDYTVYQKVSQIVSSTSSQTQRVVEKYGDFREVEGVIIPFEVTVTNASMGDIVSRIKKIEINPEIPDEKFVLKQ